MRVTLRPYTNTDAPACVAVLASNMPDYVVPHEIPQYERFLTRLEVWGCRYVVGEHEGRVVACGGLGYVAERRAGVFCWGLVERGLHRNGIGSQLVRERLGWAVDDERLERIDLDTSNRTRDFFARFGFVDTKVTPDGYAPGLHQHDMELPLDEPGRARLREALEGR